MSDDERVTYGTTASDAPVTRYEFERALRALNASDLDIRDALLKLAAHVVTLTDELTRRIDGVEPQPAPPNTPAEPPRYTVEDSVASQISGTLEQIRVSDVTASQRVAIDTSGESKYAAEGATPPCMELLDICKARCCKLTFSLSTEDLDEGVIRWDYGQPYLIRQRASDGYCVHNHPGMHGCTVHEVRPRVCRVYDCRDDKRIWIDYATKQPAPFIQPAARGTEHPANNVPYFDLVERVAARRAAVHFETAAVSQTYAEAEPAIGPAIAPRRPLLP